MQGRRSVLLAILTFAVALMITAATPAAAAEGISATVLAEFPSEIAGIEKFVLVEVRMEPGAKLENFVEHTIL